MVRKEGSVVGRFWKYLEEKGVEGVSSVATEKRTCLVVGLENVVVNMPDIPRSFEGYPVVMEREGKIRLVKSKKV